jgi:hypothetical protein
VILNALLALVGFALLILGLWWIWPPLALIVAGLGLIALGFFREVPDEAGR